MTAQAKEGLRCRLDSLRTLVQFPVTKRESSLSQRFQTSPEDHSSGTKGVGE